MDRKELHTRLLKVREEQERYTRDINYRLDRATAEHETAIGRAREFAERVGRIRREMQEHNQLTSREVERLEEMLRTSAPPTLTAFEIAIERRKSELAASAGSPVRAAEADALHEAVAWIRNAMTDSAVDDAAVLMKWRELRLIAPAVRSPEHAGIPVEVAA